MHNAIFVRLKQNLSRVFRKLTDSNTLPLPVQDQLRPHSLLFIELLTILCIRYSMHGVILLVNAVHMYHLRKVPAANHAHFQSRTSSVHSDF